MSTYKDLEIYNNQNYRKISDTCKKGSTFWEDVSNDFIYNALSDVKWKRPKDIVTNPRFIRDKAEDVPLRFSLNNIIIEKSKLKFNLAALSAITLNSDVFKFVVPDDNIEFDDSKYAGIFHFRFWRFGKIYDVVVDDRLPICNGKLVSFYKDGTPVEFWPVLLEKAYKKLCGSADSLEKTVAPDLLVDLTSGILETYIALGHKTSSLFDLETILCEASERASFILFGRHWKSDDGNTDMKQVYCVTKTAFVNNDKSERTLLLQVFMPFVTETKDWKGPWSEESDEWKAIPQEKKKEIGVPKKHEFWLPFSEFIKHDWEIYIVHLFSPHFESLKHIQNKNNTWSFNSIKSKWVNGVSSGGNRMEHVGSTFHLNPKFILSLKLSDESSTDCVVIISVLQKSDKKSRVPVHLYVFKLNKKTDERLNKKFFKHNLPIVESRSQSEAREVSTHLKIPSGDFCIVVATDKPHQEANFFLRVLANQNVTLHEVKEKVVHKDTDVRVSITPASFQKKEVQHSDGIVEAYFEEVSGEEKVVGWKGLKKVLDFAMSYEKPQSETYLVNTGFLSYLFPSNSVFDTMDDKEFSKDLTRSLLAMADMDHSGKLSLREFRGLWSQVRQWIQIYEMHSDQSGFLSKENLKDALDSAGFQLNHDILNNLAIRYSNVNNVIPFDDFLTCTSKLRIVFDCYRFKDPEYTDQAIFTIEEWLQKSIYS